MTAGRRGGAKEQKTRGRIKTGERGRGNSRFLDLHQHLPTKIALTGPSPLGNPLLRIVQTLRAKRILPCHPSQLVQEIMIIHIIHPSSFHRLLGVGSVEGSEDAFDTTELGQSVDAVSVERAQKERFVCLEEEN
ncbi:MAG: hypothetical protein L6R37_005188 [Teloschistes peruensis]|nr:MAG: hypothetical protein L6R37_005188 [Teloschistes peruensis]